MSETSESNVLKASDHMERTTEPNNQGLPFIATLSSRLVPDRTSHLKGGVSGCQAYGEVAARIVLRRSA